MFKITHYHKIVNGFFRPLSYPANKEYPISHVQIEWADTLSLAGFDAPIYTKIRDSILTPQMMILLRFATNKHQLFAEKSTLQGNFLPIPDSMDNVKILPWMPQRK